MKHVILSILVSVGVVVEAATTWRVDKSAGDDTAARADATGATAFLHLQAAINNATAGDTILVGPGVYGEEEGVFEGDGRSRICVDKKLTLKAVDPTQETAIVGAYDTTPNKCGPNAVRCVRITARGTILDGLTLRGGATLADSTSGGRSGAVYTTGSNAAKTDVYLINCTIRDCVSNADGAVYYTTMIGCRVTGCTSPNGVGGKRGGASYFTLFDNNVSGTQTTYGNNAINCTFYGNTASVTDVKKMDAEVLYNCLFSNTKGATASDLTGVDVQNLIVDADGSSMVDPANGDFRVCGGGVASGTGDNTLLTGMTLPTGYTLLNIRDPFGGAINTATLQAGAVQTAVAFLTLADDGGELLIEGATLGRNELVPGTTLRVSLSPDATRPCSGVTTNGVFVSFDDLPERTLVLTAEEMAAAGGYAIEPVYTADWYMAVDGDDTNSGFTPNTAMKTFAAVMARVQAGDTVHLAAGTYASNAGAVPMMATVKTAPIRARVVVPAGVTVVGAGQDKTIIEGADSGVTMVQEGCGPDAMICAFLNGANARLQNCTLRGGCTQLEGDSKTWKNYEQDMGGGVAGQPDYRQTQFVENCTIVGNVAGRGAGARNVNLVKCLVTGNRALENGGAGYQIYAAGTAFIANTSVNHMVLTPYGLDSCSIASNRMTSTSGVDLWITTANVQVRNTLIAGNAGKSAAGASSTFYRCLFATDGGTYPAEETGDACIRTTLDNMVTDAEGRPVVGQNAGIDQADESLYDFEKWGDNDLSGRQRVMNGTMDIGALEADYRPTYQQVIGLKRGEITEVSRNVVRDGEALRLAAGDAVTFDWIHKAGGVCAVRVSVDAGTTITVHQDGVILGSVTGPASAQEIQFTSVKGTRDNWRVSCVGDGNATFAVRDVALGAVIIIR